eukprot:TRINITY_DN5975_c0_g1_i1.p2 TRINITY_DN5975_c0_g1~~TRINITY_DN5975_c0_g1_i1.p2  ORF type:complete len:182 (-),score=13.66 TRINITY_DN5975_c0_g1_i1:501-1046(-)
MSNFGRRRNNVKPGDWTCSCGEHNFASRSVCRSCNGAKPAAPASRGRLQAGRLAVQPVRRAQLCLALALPQVRGGQAAGGRVQVGLEQVQAGRLGVPRLQGTQLCLAHRVPQVRPRQARAWGMQMLRGDWLCDDCSEHNFASRTECRKCGNEKPEEEEEDDYGAGAGSGSGGAAAAATTWR